MSATGRGAQRRELDFYPTPSWPVWRFLDRLEKLNDRGLHWRYKPLVEGGAKLLEPCVGDGSIVLAVNEWLEQHDRPTGRREQLGFPVRHAREDSRGIQALDHDRERSGVPPLPLPEPGDGPG